MVDITTLDGQVIYTSPDSVVLVAGPYSNDVGPHTYVYGAAKSVIVTAEDPGALVARLQSTKPFIVLTRPNGTPVWIKAVAASSVRDALPTEAPAVSVLSVGSLHQALLEDVASVRATVNAAGGNL